MDKKKQEEKKVDKNAQRIIDLENKVKDFENSWKRALADYKNLEKRTTQEKLAIAEFANSVVVEQLLPVLDNFEMLLEHTDDKGLEMSVKELQRVLISSGLNELNIEIGKDFDPEYMDAVESINGDNGKILEIVRKGYKFKEKLLRPISVKVGNGKN
ncbi:nucleotide exchange factor GrpE [Patescibacteria group bacterium]